MKDELPNIYASARIAYNYSNVCFSRDRLRRLRGGNEMSEINEKLKEISDTMSEHIITVKGTLELLDASVTEDDLRSLVLKAIERMDNMQQLSDELFVVLKQAIEKMKQTKDSKE